MKTLILHHDDCQNHDTGPHHPERPERVTTILSAIAGLPGTERLAAPLASAEQVLRAHDRSYWAGLQALDPGPERLALDADTYVSAGSLEAALRGSGGTCFAVDQVLAGQSRNAFVVTRPPGHHAEAATAMGFCLLNHVAIAARHAQAAHGIKRVAILDFDVHHGNGTQAIFEDSPDVMYLSSHQVPLYPGTGLPMETGCGNILNLALEPGAGSKAFRKLWSAAGFPALRHFRPELILVSAGFDAHKRDPLGQLELVDDDFGWITSQIRAYAESACSGRMVSVLEGGYDLEALAGAAVAHVTALAA
ncbi:MAG: histone deacetylase family protein [Xanthomonadales bacterium]|nr:histone deacetylase family protein [Xanthomonadales bacterium]